MNEEKRETLRRWLNRKNFDWLNGVIVWQRYSSKWSCGPESAEVIEKNHPILDHAFYAGFGGGLRPHTFSPKTRTQSML